MNRRQLTTFQRIELQYKLESIDNEIVKAKSGMSDGGKSGAEKRWGKNIGNENLSQNADGKVVQNYTTTSNQLEKIDKTLTPLTSTEDHENSLQHHTPICRAENIRFKAEIIRMPSIPVDWHKVEMQNWDQYCSTISGIKVHINLGNQPTIEFIPGAIDGDNPDSLRIKLLQACTDAAAESESTLNMKIGRLELSSRGEWVAYDPIAHTYSKQFGQITINGVGKVNASKPSGIGAFEFLDPRDCADYMAMPKRLANVEQDVKKILTILKKNEEIIEIDHNSQ